MLDRQQCDELVASLQSIRLLCKELPVFGVQNYILIEMFASSG